jgi:hypothetical protein
VVPRTDVPSTGPLSCLRSLRSQDLAWVDHRVGSERVTYLGQQIQDPNGLLLTVFWNRSIRHVYSLDGKAPGPGPTGTPDFVAPDGTLSRLPPDTKYVLTDNGVALQQPVVDRWGLLTLYRKDGPWRLLDGAQQLYSDGWVPGWSSDTYFRPGQKGTLVVTLSRTAFNGSAPPGRARIVAGEVRIDPALGGAAMGRITTRRSAVVRNGTSQEIRLPVERTPVRVELTITPTFHASVSDRRDLGAQVRFQFVPADGD